MGLVRASVGNGKMNDTLGEIYILTSVEIIQTNSRSFVFGKIPSLICSCTRLVPSICLLVNLEVVWRPDFNYI